MSFTSTVKNEVSKLEINNVEKIAELEAILANGAILEDNIIKITTENASVSRRIFNLIKDIYHIIPNIIVRRSLNFNKKYLYILHIKNKNIDLSNKIPKDYIIDDEESIRAYLRGLFLMSGSINDPKTSRYHLEFLVNDEKYAFFISDLINKYNLNSKVLKRETKYMIYIKEAEKISDFLRLINAYNAVMYYEDIRIYRDHKNMTNRLNNCEQANMDKVFFTASSQLSDIEKIKNFNMLDLIDSKLREVIEYRVKYPEASLAELSVIMSNDGIKITKSGLNHRFRKIKEIVSDIENKNR